MITKYQGKRVLDKILGSVDFTNEFVYIGLSKTPIVENGTGATEPLTETNYRRVKVANNKATTWNLATDLMELTNKAVIEFAESTAPFGAITHVFISDSQTGGNILYYEKLLMPDNTDRTINVEAFTTLRFRENELKFSLKNV